MDEPEEIEDLEVEEGADDPLAALDETTRAAVDAAIAAQVEAERARLEEDNKQFRTGYQRRLETARTAFQEQFGLDIDADGKPVYRDPAKFGQAALGLVGGGGGRQAAADGVPDEVKAPITYEESPELLEAKVKYRIQQEVKAVQATYDQKFSAIEERLNGVGGLATAPLLREAPAAARQILAEQEIGHLADHQEFDQVFVAQLQTLPPEQWGDPAAVGTIAAQVGTALRLHRPDGVIQRTAQERAAALAAAHRASLTQTRASSGGQREATLDAEDREAMSVLGVRNLAELQALASDETGASFYALRNKPAGRR